MVAAGAGFALFALFLVFFGPDLMRAAGEISLLGALRPGARELATQKTVAAAPRQPGGPPVGASGASGAAADTGVGSVQVRLATALTAHSRYQELALLDREIARWRGETEASQGAGFATTGSGTARGDSGRGTATAATVDSAGPGVDAVAGSHSRSLASEYDEAQGRMNRAVAERLQEEQKSLESEIQQKVDWKRAELADKLDEEVGLERDSRDKELQRFIEDTNGRFVIKILNARLRANVLDTEAARRQADDEVKTFEAEAGKAIEAEKERHAKELAAFGASRAAAYDKQLKAYATQLAEEAQVELRTLQKSLEEADAQARQVLDQARSVSHEALGALGNGMATTREQSTMDAGLQRLLAQRSALLESMKKDVRDAAARVAREMGARVVEFVTPDGATGQRGADGGADGGAADITKRVMGILSSQG